MKSISIVAIAIGTLAVTQPVTAAPLLWNAGTADWFVAGNWAPPQVPTAADDTTINNGGTANATGTTVEANDINVGLRNVGILPLPHGIGVLNVTNADIAAGNDLVVGMTNTSIGAIGFSAGSLTVTGGASADGNVSVANDFSVGYALMGPIGLSSGTADIQTGNVTGGGGTGLLSVGRTGDESTSQGSANGTMTVAGDVSGFVLGVVGITGLRSTGNATGNLTIGGTYSGGNGLQVGTAGGSGTADGTATVGNGINNVSVVSVGGGGGDPSATGNSIGHLDVLAGGVQGTSGFGVGTTNGPGNATGTATVNGAITGFSTVNVGRTFDKTTGSATGTLALVDGGLQATNLFVGVSDGSGSAAGTLDLNDNLADIVDTMTLGDGSTLVLGIDGFLRGVDYGAVDTGVALLDGILEVDFSFSPVAGIFDLIVSGGSSGITGNFDAVNILGLDPGTLVSHGIVLDGGVEIYRLQIGDGTPVGAPAPDTLVVLASGLILLVAVRRRRAAA